MISTAKMAAIESFIDDKYLSLEKRIKISILVSIFILPALLFYFLVFNPQAEKIAVLKKNLDVASEELKKAKKIASELPKFKKEFEDVQREFDATSALLPKSQEIPNLLRSISDLGRNAGLDFVRFVPGVETPKDFYAEIPIDISIIGSYHNLGSFLDKVSKLDRIVTVNNINLDRSAAAKDETELLLASTCRLVTYRFTGVKIQPPPGGKAK
jgi:type IV pilus assembly protein PilO